MARLYNADTNTWESNSQSETYFSNREAWESAGMTGGMTRSGLESLASSGVLGKDSSGNIVRNIGGDSGSTGSSPQAARGAAIQSANIQIAAAPQAIPVVTTVPSAPQIAPTPQRRPSTNTVKPSPATAAIPAIDAIGSMPAWLDFSVGFGPAVPQANGTVDTTKGQERLTPGFDYTPKGTVNTTSSNPIMVTNQRDVPLPQARPNQAAGQVAAVNAPGTTVAEISSTTGKPVNQTSQGLNIRSVTTVPVTATPQVESRTSGNALTSRNLSWEPAQTVRPSVTTKVQERELLPPLAPSTLWSAVLQDAPAAQRVQGSYVSRSDIPDIGQPGAPTQSSLMRMAGVAPKPATMSSGVAMVREYNSQSQAESRPQASESVKPWLNFLAGAEGTAEEQGYRGYNETLAYGALTGGDQNLTQMSIREVRRLQQEMLNNPNNQLNSSAVGRYQIVGTTLEGLISTMGLTGEERFDEQMQDAMAEQLLRGRGLERFQAGELSEDAFMNNLNQEWASFPASGDAVGPGQNITNEAARASLTMLRGF